MENLIRTNISLLCKEYTLDNSVYDMLLTNLEFDKYETILLMQDIVLSRVDDSIPEIAYKILIETTRISSRNSVDSMFRFIRNEKINKTVVYDIEDMYILLRALRIAGFDDRIICKHFLDIYLPYKDITVPFYRDKTVRARYTSDVVDDIIYVNIPTGDYYSPLEELENRHIYLSREHYDRK